MKTQDALDDVMSEPFLIAILDTDIDIEPLVRETRKIVAAYKKNYSDKVDLTRPYTIVLTESEQDSKDGGLVSYDTVHDQAHFDRDKPAVLKAEYQKTAFKDLVAKLPFPFSIIRLSVLPPTTIIGMHTDESCHAQLAMYTNQDCFVAARSGETKHVPTDGKLYIISTTLPHMAFNSSQEERVHVSISIFDEDYTNLLKQNNNTNKAPSNK